MARSVEGKTVARIRNILKDNSTVNQAFGDRIYDSHISSIYQPEYPAISLTVITSKPLSFLPPAVDMVIQVDIWEHEREGVKDNLYTYMDAIRAAIHLPPGPIYDSTTALTLMELRETDSGALLFEPDTNLWHLAKRFKAVGL